MLGRTHMGIGAIAAVAATPFILGTRWETLRRLGDGNWGHLPHMLVAQAVLVAAAVVGSLLPDLDQSDSTMSHKIEVIGQGVIMAMLACAVLILHLQTSVTAWVTAILLGWLVGARNNVARKVGLALPGAGILYLAWDKEISLLAAGCLVAWVVGAMLTRHRTFTHSLLGLGLFAVGIHGSFHGLTLIHARDAAVGLMLGYALHLVADGVAGGVPLLWPWGQRFGVRLVKTGGGLDHFLSGITMFGFIALAIW